MEKNTMKNTMKVATFFLVSFLWLFIVTESFGLGIPDQNQPRQFNYEFNEALKYEWKIKIQETSWLSLFDEARQKVQSIKNTKEGSKTTEVIHTMWNDFCRWLYGTCDETSIYARLIAWCNTARDSALQKIESGFIKNNTKLLLASYSSCHDLASDVVKSYKDAASIEVAGWNKGEIVKSQEKFIEKSQTSFQEKVSNTWDVFKKKLTNFVRSVQGITRNVNIRW